MKKYDIEFTNSALKEFEKIDSRAKIRISKKLEELSVDPFASDLKKLSGLVDFYRVRTGDFRLIFYIEKAENIVVVTRIRHRKDVYKR